MKVSLNDMNKIQMQMKPWVQKNFSICVCYSLNVMFWQTVIYMYMVCHDLAMKLIKDMQNKDKIRINVWPKNN